MNFKNNTIQLIGSFLVFYLCYYVNFLPHFYLIFLFFLNLLIFFILNFILFCHFFKFGIKANIIITEIQR